MRLLRPQDQSWQDYWGPIEHEQFVREVTKSNPLLGTLLAAGSIPYTLLKAGGVNLGGTGETLTSRPSLQEVLTGMRGYGGGLGDFVGGR